MSAGPGGEMTVAGGAGVDLITGCQYIKATETKTNGYQKVKVTVAGPATRGGWCESRRWENKSHWRQGGNTGRGTWVLGPLEGEGSGVGGDLCWEGPGHRRTRSWLCKPESRWCSGVNRPPSLLPYGCSCDHVWRKRPEFLNLRHCVRTMRGKLR